MKLVCSFCHKGQNAVRLLLAAPRARICDECTALAAETVAAFHAQKVEVVAEQRSDEETFSDAPGSVLHRRSLRIFMQKLPKWFRAELK